MAYKLQIINIKSLVAIIINYFACDNTLPEFPTFTFFKNHKFSARLKN